MCSTHARVDLLPRARRVGLARGVDGRLVLAEVHQAGGKAREVGDRVEEDLRRLVHGLGVAALGDVLDAPDVGRRDELLELGVVGRLAVRVDERRVDVRLLDLLAAHLQVRDEPRVRARRVGRVDHARYSVASFALMNEPIARRPAAARAGPAEHHPHLLLVDALGELGRALDALDVVDEHLRRLAVQLRLLEDHERFLVQLGADGDVGDVGHVVVAQPVNVVHHARLVRLDCREDEQVLQVLVVGELGRLQHDLLEQLDQLVREVRRHERLHGRRDDVGVLRLGQRVLHDGVDALPPVLVLLGQHRRPQVEVLPLDEVARLLLVQPVPVGHVDELASHGRACTRGTRGAGRASRSTADHLRVVVVVRGEVLLRAVVHVDVDLHQRVVHRSLLHTLVLPLLEPRLEQLEAVALLHLLDELLGGSHGPHGKDERAHKVLRAVGVEERARHLRRLHRVDLLHVELDVLRHIVRVQEVREVLDHVVPVAHVDERPLVGQARLLKEVLHLLGVEEGVLARDALDLLQVAHLGRRLDVLEVHRLVLRLEQHGAEVVEEPSHEL